MVQNSREKKAEARLRKQQQHSHNEYSTAAEKMSVNDKLEVLQELGRADLIDIFKGWQPRRSPAKKRGAPLDQRVTITVTDAEREKLDREIKAIKQSGASVSMSQFIRNRAVGSVDINGWREIATEALGRLENIVEKQSTLRSRRQELVNLIEDENDGESLIVYEREMQRIQDDLDFIVAQNERRKNRLSGRMSMIESETIKWRAERLCISTSDYLRMLIFGLEPASSGDAHMSLDAKRRFYVSIIDVAKNGWGDPPKIYNCSQCENYMDTIRSLKEEIRQLRTFA